MRRIFDLVIVGAGPAGTSAAITATHLGCRVLLLEAGKFPRHKVCGEFVSGEALALLDDLLGPSELLVVAPRISRVRLFLEHRELELPVVPAAASLSRYTLDEALWSASASRGVSLRDRTTVRRVDAYGELFVVRTDEEEIHARAVINAAGRWSNLGSPPRLTGESWIGLKGHFKEESSPAFCDLYFFAGGYCGVQPLGNGRVNVAAMVKPTAAKTLAAACTLHRRLQARWRQWDAAIDPITTAPLIFRSPRTSDKGVALCGDAAAFLDPFAGDGISIALHSGRLAAISLLPYLDGKCSLKAALSAYDRAYRNLIQPVLRNAAGLRVLLAFPKGLQTITVAALKFPPFGRALMKKTRVRGFEQVKKSPACGFQ